MDSKNYSDYKVRSGGGKLRSPTPKNLLRNRRGGILKKPRAQSSRLKTNIHNLQSTIYNLSLALPSLPSSILKAISARTSPILALDNKIMGVYNIIIGMWVTIMLAIAGLFATNIISLRRKAN